MTSPPRGGGGGSPKGDITLKGYSIKVGTMGRGCQKSHNGGDVIYECPLTNPTLFSSRKAKKICMGKNLCKFQNILLHLLYCIFPKILLQYCNNAIS